MEIPLLKMQLEDYLVKKTEFPSKVSLDNIAHLQTGGKVKSTRLI